MHTSTLRSACGTPIHATPFRSVTHLLLGCLVTLSATGLPGDAPNTAEPAPPPVCCADEVTTDVSGRTRPAGTAPHGDGKDLQSEPDQVADDVGGLAARLHASDGTPVVGDVFLLMGTSGSTRNARLYDRTPFMRFDGAHPDTLGSNLLAAETVGTITGVDVELLELTGAPGGGRSGGLAYAIAYLNVVSDGAFTGDLRVAATGRLGSEGQINQISHIEVKTTAALLADADVLFTPTAPTSAVRDVHGARFVGELVGDPVTAGALNDERRLDAFRSWGADRPEGMDIVDVRHLIDVAAYVCGSGSTYACHVTELLDRRARQRLDGLQAEAASEVDRLRARRPSVTTTPRARGSEPAAHAR